MKWLLLIMVMISSSALAQIEVTAASTTVWNDGSFINDDEPDSGEAMPGCSWYCGGMSPLATASSQLKGAAYAPDRAHDFNFKTAWVEGVEGNGAGEYLEYSFKMNDQIKRPEDFGINQIVIFNGYWKSDKLWHANGRVKNLKMYVNGVPTCIFTLADVKHPQSATFPFIALKAGEKVVLRFEIIDVYPGKKYDDTAISELLFGGTGVH